MFETAARIFDRLIVAPIRNPGKSKGLFSITERVEMLEKILAHLDNVDVVMMKTLTADAAREVGADVIVKGLRVASDFEFELQMAHTNKAISGIKTVFLPCGPDTSFIASSLIREISAIGGGHRVSSMVPATVAERLEEKFPLKK